MPTFLTQVKGCKSEVEPESESLVAMPSFSARNRKLLEVTLRSTHETQGAR